MKYSSNTVVVLVLDVMMFIAGCAPVDCMNDTSELHHTVPLCRSHPLSNLTGCSMAALDPQQTEAEYKQLYLKLQFTTGLICYPIMCFFGFTGNILSLIVLSHRKMRSSTNTYLQALAVSDTIKVTNDFFYFLTILFLNINPPFGNKMYGYLYPYAHYFFNMSVCCTAWITVSVAAERYILVCYATRAKSICNLDRARVISLIVFVTMSVITIPLGLRYRTIHVVNNKTYTSELDVEVTELWQNKGFVTLYQWVQNFLRSVIPLLILIILNYFIIAALWRTRATKKRLSSRHRITLMLVSVIVVFLVCVTPDAIMSTFFGFGYYDANYLARAVREITDLLLLVNSTVNFILYCTFNKLFRREFMDMFCQCRYWPSRRMLERPTDGGGEREYGHTSFATTFRQTVVGLNRSSSAKSKYDPDHPPLFENEEVCDDMCEELCQNKLSATLPQDYSHQTTVAGKHVSAL